VQAQERDPDSTLAFYKAALAARRKHAVELGDRVEVDVVDDVLIVRRDQLTAVLNCGDRPARLPEGDLLISSGPLVDGAVPPDTAVWLRAESPND
jgi:alpha-glucosidase